MSVQRELTEPIEADVASVIDLALVVDDSRSQRRILSAYLKRWGYQVVEAASGIEGLEICRTQKVDLVLSDWMMPGMNGLEFCTAFREMENENYGYFILLTSKSEKGEVAHGLDVGADDFLTKPVASMELRARINAGERILRMQRELTEKNRLVSETLAEISTLYDSVDRDLIEARGMQQALLREKFRDFGAAQISMLLKPSGHVGGDLVGFFEINQNEIGMYSIDVSGHGVASALMTARLAGYLSGSSPNQNIALRHVAGRAIVPRPPAQAAEMMNYLVMEEMETELYFTMLLGHMNLTSGRGCFVQCGHPNALVQRSDGHVELFGDGGLPVGLIGDATWSEFDVELSSGDRLLLASDGFTECPNPEDILLDDEGLACLMRRHKSLHSHDFFDTLVWDLAQFAGDRPFPDDISAVLYEFGGES